MARTTARQPVVLACVALAVGGATTGCGTPADRGEGDGRASDDGTQVDVAYAIDPSDERELVAFGENVFVGRVLRRTGTVSSPTSNRRARVPLTLFDVAVTRNIKGRLNGVVRVGQYGQEGRPGASGGARRRAPAPPERWGGDPLLRPGEEVLFVTRHNAAREWHTIVAQPFADRRLRTSSERRRLVGAFTKATRDVRAKEDRRPSSP